jgi:hypothetical protein
MGGLWMRSAARNALTKEKRHRKTTRITKKRMDKERISAVTKN